jgi:hypothetical protein
MLGTSCQLLIIVGDPEHHFLGVFIVHYVSDCARLCGALTPMLRVINGDFYHESSAMLRASPTRAPVLGLSSMEKSIGLDSSVAMGTTHRAKTLTTMPSAKEFRQNEEDCLTLARETTEMYARIALIEMATEFRVMADDLERDATRRTADKIRRRVASFLRRVG